MTAYEMRISDGVQTCALPISALIGSAAAWEMQKAVPCQRSPHSMRKRAKRRPAFGDCTRTPSIQGSAARAGRSVPLGTARLDRKRDVERKSVSVRVDLGGDRVIKTNNNNNLRKVHQHK